MKENKLETITNLFENSTIRSIWNEEKEEYYFSVIDIIGALTNNDYQKSRNSYEKATNKSAISNENALNYQYVNETKQIEDNNSIKKKYRLH